jgi:hypothetical protein
MKERWLKIEHIRDLVARFAKYIETEIQFSSLIDIITKQSELF